MTDLDTLQQELAEAGAYQPLANAEDQYEANTDVTDLRAAVRYGEYVTDLRSHEPPHPSPDESSDRRDADSAERR